MTVTKFACALFAALFVAPLTAAAQQPLPAIAPPGVSSPSQRITLDVVVSTKSGQPVTSLRQQDFTVFDNKNPRPITSFKVVTPAQEPVEVILFLDAVNTPFSTVAYMRGAVEKFLKSNEGRLANPTSIAILTDDGVKINNSFSTDGNALSDELEHHIIGLRQITRDSQWSDADRLTLCLRALHQFVTFAASLPSRKVILWISPGWPLLSGPETEYTSKQQQQVFDDVLYFSSQLRQANMTLYDINPFGVSESMYEAYYYENFVKGLTKLRDAQFGDVSLQVLSVQSGGLVLESNSDVDGLMQKCLADLQSWYQITYDLPPADKPNEYHHIEIKLSQPGLVARTRDGYYSNPVAVESAP
jgi:VWFA-related protein